MNVFIFLVVYLSIGVIISSIVYGVLKYKRGIGLTEPHDAFLLVPAWFPASIIGCAWLLGNCVYKMIKYFLDKRSV